MDLTDYHAKYFAYDLTRRCPPDSVEKLAGAVAGAQVDLNPHQVDAALFAFNSPLSKGAILADEVGLGKTIEAGLVLSQKWAERKRRILVITPSNLRKQWYQELTEKFFLPCRILEAKSYNAAIKQGQFRPFEASEIIICSYQFAKSKADDVHALPWDLVVIDEAHRLRNVYKPANVIANTLKMALAGKHKLLLTATPLQNSLLELFGLVSFIDERTFGDLKSFREQYTNLNQEQVFHTLKARLRPVCHRTLRRQVTAYIPYTRRLPLVEEFTPEESEDRLYHLVSEYLQRENLQALLLEDPGKSYHSGHRMTENDIFDNRLIFGDNLLALKALEAEFAGKVKCVFIDPPYNTGSAFEHYDDGVEHSIWLSLMRDRLEIIRRLLSEDGSLWITIDDNEAHYLKVLCDEVFGRKSFVANVVWQNRYSRSNDASLSLSHNHLLVYAQNAEVWKEIRNRLPRTEEQAAQYKNPDNDSNGPWRAIPWDAPNLRPNLSYPITTPTGRVRHPPEGRCWSRTEDQWLEIVAAGLAYFGKSGDGAPSFKQYLKDAAPIVPNTWWPHEEAGHTDEAKKEMHALSGKELAFDTPKPERLLHRVIHIATNPGDLVLDSFAGSGTTGAVAHKMGRRWIMVELGEHCHTHIIPRLQKVIEGQDPGGISKAVNWQGGGGFRYYRLAPSLLQQDRWGNWVVNKEYNAEMLATAICKLEGFTYMPSDVHYWQHGNSTENDFIYVTTQTLSAEQLQALSDEVGEGRSLLVCCGAFRGAADRFTNLTIKKIPKMVLQKCEWGRDDYSLNVTNVPIAEPSPLAPLPQAGEGRIPSEQGDLF